MESVGHFMSRLRAGAALEVRWTLKGPSGRILCCRIHRHPGSGFAVVTRYDGAFVRMERVGALDEARGLAERWRQGVLDIGGFTQVPAYSSAGTPPTAAARPGTTGGPR